MDLAPGYRLLVAGLKGGSAAAGYRQRPRPALTRRAVVQTTFPSAVWMLSPGVVPPRQAEGQTYGPIDAATILLRLLCDLLCGPLCGLRSDPASSIDASRIGTDGQAYS